MWMGWVKGKIERKKLRLTPQDGISQVREHDGKGATVAVGLGAPVIVDWDQAGIAAVAVMAMRERTGFQCIFWC